MRGRVVESDNERFVRRFVEDVINLGETDLLPALVASDHIGHDPLGDHYGPEGVRISITELRSAFPDLWVTIEDVIAARDLVAHRFTLRGTHRGPYLGLPATGRAIATTGIAIDRVVGGCLAESWHTIDSLGFVRQVGAVLTTIQRATE